MALRLIEILLPADLRDDLHAVLAELALDEDPYEAMLDGRSVTNIVVDAEVTGELVDAIEGRFGQETGFRLLILPLEAVLPRREALPAEEVPAEPGPPPRPSLARGLSREELYQDVVDMTKTSSVFVMLVVVSAVVAALGLLRDNVAVVIGAMVIAPLLGPNVALAFGTTLGEKKLLRDAIRTNLVGVVITLALSIMIAVLFRLDAEHVLESHEIASRTQADPQDILLALGAGCVGALAVTTAVSSTLVGVMVAVALMPPAVVLGLCLGSRAWPEAGGAGILLAINVIGINLAGILTFLAFRISPRTWWEKAEARRSARIALGVWIAVLLVMLTIVVWLSRGEASDAVAVAGIIGAEVL